ncbi:myeloid differentiation primary response protein MyD88 [Orussus abietinus]|uniref:myeloid differentiation primary response protein MyD88 n=1 Tax=Orussus abietinus TaxID=222816 RepID=UPI0006255374|nr:myeloid differentiation primary response protein MyD88 [Orussus abietinus]
MDPLSMPLVGLTDATMRLMSTLLNPLKIIPTEDGFPRDWRGLAHLLNLDGEIMPSIMSEPDPTGHILSIMRKDFKSFMVKDLRTMLETLDRWDVVDDTEDLIEKDAEVYAHELEKSKTSAEIIQPSIDRQMLTIDDLYRFRQGLDEQYYDAFLLYADEDLDFAKQMIEKLEKEYGLKLCIKDRDLVGGITFEHEAVMQLISERCNRLIVIISPNFVKSPANKFFLNYAQALGIDKRQRKVIPCLYQKCQLPPQLSYTFILDYSRIGLYDFWGRLRDSVMTPTAADGCRKGHITAESQGLQFQTAQVVENSQDITAKEENKLNATLDESRTFITKNADDIKKPENNIKSSDSSKPTRIQEAPDLSELLNSTSDPSDKKLSTSSGSLLQSLRAKVQVPKLKNISSAFKHKSKRTKIKLEN